MRKETKIAQNHQQDPFLHFMQKYNLHKLSLSKNHFDPLSLKFVNFTQKSS